MIVAVKELNVREQGLQKVEIEINNLKNIKSENVVQLYDYAFDRVNGMCYLILEFCNQGPLSNHIDNLSISQAI
jgi:serine/threonine protein kinase